MRFKRLSSRLLPATQTAVLPVGLYLVTCLLTFKYFQYIAYKDEVNYISIGERFARGDFTNGPNAYWSPLLPLLVAVFLRLGLAPIIAAKVVDVLIGALALLAVRALALRFAMSEFVRALVLLLSVPALAYYAYFAINPDLLFTAVLLFYFSVVFDPAYPDRRGAGWMCGLLGAAAYLTKAFGFPFFLVHFSLITIAHVALNRAQARRQVLWHFARGLLVFCCVAVAWGYMLNRKYHDPAVWIGISGPYNHATRGPDFFDARAAPTTRSGFVKPWDGDVSIWQEPYYFLKRVRPWSPFDSRLALRHQLKLTRRSTINIVGIYGSFTAFWAVIVLGTLLLMRGVTRREPQQFGLAAALATLALYTAFYASLHSEEHYLWPMGLLILLMGGALLDHLFRSPLTAGVFRKTLVVIVFAVSFLRHPLHQLVVRANNGRGLARMAERLRAEGVGGRIASNYDIGSYGNSVVVAYHLRATFYGHPKSDMTETETISELKRHQIRFYLAWLERSPLPDSIVRRIAAFEEDEQKLTVYAVVP